MLQLDTYLFFDGNCADAMRFYERTLGGKLHLMTHGESPMAAQPPPGSANRILHARLELDGRLLMASDSMVGQPYEKMKGFSLSLILRNPAACTNVASPKPEISLSCSRLLNGPFAER